MVKKRRKKSGSSRILFWVITLVLFGVLIAGLRLWSCLYNVTPQFYYILISKNDNPLKLLNGETILLHPEDRIRILNISSSICFNRGIRLNARGFDVNALLLEEMPISDLLPGKDIFGHYSFRIWVKYVNQEIGHVDILVEPFVEDWLDKANRTIEGKKKIEVLEQALKQAPDDRRIKERLISEYISLHRWEEAALMLESLLKKEGPDQALLHSLLEVYESMSRKEGVISVLRKLIELNPEDMDLRLRLAKTLEEDGRLEEAIKEYEEIVNRGAKEDLLPVYNSLGFLYTKTGQVQKAIDVYLKALEMDKDDVNLYYNLSMLYEKIGQKDRSDFYLSKAVELKSGDIEGRLKLSEDLIEKGSLEEAEKYLKEVLKTRPESQRALSLLAGIAEKKGDKEGLKGLYKRMLTLDPKNLTLVYNLGIIEYETGDLVNAIPYLTRYVEAHPDDKEVHTFLFDIYRKQKMDDKAFKEALILTRLKPEEVDFYDFIFEYLNGRGNYEEMIRVMNEGLKSHAKDIDLRKYLILAYLKTGKEDLALEQIKEVLNLDPDNVTMLLQLARLQEKRGTPVEALATYKKILDLSPDNEEAEAAYLRLRLEVLPKR